MLKVHLPASFHKVTCCRSIDVDSIPTDMLSWRPDPHTLNIYLHIMFLVFHSISKYTSEVLRFFTRRCVHLRINICLVKFVEEFFQINIQFTYLLLLLDRILSLAHCRVCPVCNVLARGSWFGVDACVELFNSPHSW